MNSDGADARNRPRMWAMAAAAFIVTGIVAWFAHWQSGAPMREIQELVRQSLRDPTSAEFRNVREAAGGVCGEVNAKNGFGGMAGFAPFFISSGTASTQPHVYHDPRMIEIMCEGK